LPHRTIGFSGGLPWEVKGVEGRAGIRAMSGEAGGHVEVLEKVVAAVKTVIVLTA